MLYNMMTLYETVVLMNYDLNKKMRINVDMVTKKMVKKT